MEMPNCRGEMNMNTILNIAAGKQLPLDLPKNYFLINTDTMYYDSTSPDIIEKEWVEWDKSINKLCYCKSDIYKFMERTKIIFDNVYIYRFLEHVPMDKLSYFIYLISTITTKNSKVDVIVPNYETLAEMILKEDFPYDKGFEAHNILLTTELLNQPSDPHATVWTPDRMTYFWELEDRFKLLDINNNFDFDGRDIYIRAIMERI